MVTNGLTDLGERMEMGDATRFQFSAVSPSDPRSRGYAFTCAVNLLVGEREWELRQESLLLRPMGPGTFGHIAGRPLLNSPTRKDITTVPFCEPPQPAAQPATLSHTPKSIPPTQYEASRNGTAFPSRGRIYFGFCLFIFGACTCGFEPCTYSACKNCDRWGEGAKVAAQSSSPARWIRATPTSTLTRL